MIHICSIDYEMPGESVGTQFVAREANELIGLCTVVFYSGETLPQLQRLFVKRECRGHGIADRLMTAAEDLCRSHDWKALRLNVHPSNGDVARYYVARGYEVEGRTIDGGLALRKQIS